MRRVVASAIVIDPEEIRRRYTEERPNYQQLIEVVEGVIQPALHAQDLRCHIGGRTKEPQSLIKKAIKKGYSYDQIGDKAGVKVVANFPWQREAVEQTVKQAIEPLFTTIEYDDKRAVANPDRFGYRATHLQVEYSHPDANIQGLQCEIQIMTRAESLWADTTHDLSYKPDKILTTEIRRICNRLVGLLELFDLEFQRAYEEIEAMPKSRGAQLLNILLPHHRQIVGPDYDRELSEMVLDFLGEHVVLDDLDVVEARVDGFVSNNRDRVERLLGHHRGNEYANPLLWQPELFIILYQLETDKFALQDAWHELLPEKLLAMIADEWGIRFTQLDL